MSIITIIVGAVGLLFFIMGCLQVVFYASAAPMSSLAVYISGLAMAAWPMGVGAVLFGLLNIRVQVEASRSKRVDDDEEEIREAPVVVRRVAETVAVDHRPSAAPETAPTVIMERSAPRSASPFATPPPFEQTPDVKPKENREGDSSDLSFFKL